MMSLTVFHYLALIVGSVTALIGILAALKPEPMSKKFGITAKGSALPYVVSTGVRDVFMGFTILILFYKQAWALLGWIHLGLGFVAISDFLVVYKHGDRKTSFVHIFSAVIVVMFGLWLLCGN